jgi:hypothetical protein
MTIKHYALFNKPTIALNSAEAWKNLRNDPSEPSFFIPEAKDKYEIICNERQNQQLVDFIKNIARENECNHIFSVGSGIAILEFGLKKQTNLKVTVSDYNDSIFKLAPFNIFDNVIQFDAFNDVYPIDDKTIVLFNRIDTEFDNQDWKHIFDHLSLQNVGCVICIPTQFLTIRATLVQLKILIKSIISSKKRTDCGYIRTQGQFIKGFKTFFNHKLVTVNHKNLFILKRK